MTAVFLDEITLTVDTKAEPDPVHLVCHCTNGDVAACGKDVSDSDWANEAPDEKDCPLCVLAWPDGEPCPSGCKCEACWVPVVWS